MIGSTPETQDLVTLARSKFDRLSESELKMLRAASASECAYCGPSDGDHDPGNDPAKADEWSGQRTIRAALIRWLGVEQPVKVHHRGIQVHAAQIADALDLAFVTVPFPLAFINCVFASEINLHNAQHEALYLRASRTAAIVADGLKVRGDLFLDAGNAEDEVRLAGAEIGGNLLSDFATFKRGLLADGIKVNGYMSFRAGNAEDEVRLAGAEIGGNLLCDDASFKRGLLADGIKVNGYMSFRAGNAEGEVRLAGAYIRGDFNCSKAIFNNPGGIALLADGIKVSGDVFVCDEFKAEGEVRLVGADIGKNLECGSGTFKNSRGIALLADGIKVSGDVSLRAGFNAEGEVRLIRADIGRNFKCDTGTFNNVGRDALSADGIKVVGDVLLIRGFYAEGEVRLVGAHIGENLLCDEGVFENGRRIALNASGVSVTGSVFLRNRFGVEGEVRLAGAHISGNLDCRDVEFTPDSRVNISQASVTGTLLWRGVRWNLGSKRQAEPNSPEPLLNLAHTSVGSVSDDKNSWPIGRLRLDGFVYSRFADASDDAKSRLEWLSWQEPGFWPRPYLQLAKVLREVGDDSGARRVFVALENSRRKNPNLSWWSRRWAGALRVTIGYGYQPLLAGWWVALFVIIGFFSMASSIRSRPSCRWWTCNSLSIGFRPRNFPLSTRSTC